MRHPLIARTRIHEHTKRKYREVEGHSLRETWTQEHGVWSVLFLWSAYFTTFFYNFMKKIRLKFTTNVQSHYTEYLGQVYRQNFSWFSSARIALSMSKYLLRSSSSTVTSIVRVCVTSIIRIISSEELYVRQHAQCGNKFYGVLESDIEAKNQISKPHEGMISIKFLLSLNIYIFFCLIFSRMRMFCARSHTPDTFRPMLLLHK